MKTYDLSLQGADSWDSAHLDTRERSRYLERTSYPHPRPSLTGISNFGPISNFNQKIL